MPTGALPATGSRTYLEALQLVQPVNLVAPDLPALAGQQDTQTLVPESWSRRGQIPYPLAQYAQLKAMLNPSRNVSSTPNS